MWEIGGAWGADMIVGRYKRKKIRSIRGYDNVTAIPDGFPPQLARVWEGEVGEFTVGNQVHTVGSEDEGGKMSINHIHSRLVL